MKRNTVRAVLAVALSLASLTTTALAADASKDGVVADITVHASWSYDELRLAGNPDVCTGANSGWEHRVRFYHSDSGYDAVVRMAIASKLSGTKVKITANVESGKCVLEGIRMLP